MAFDSILIIDNNQSRANALRTVLDFIDFDIDVVGSEDFEPALQETAARTQAPLLAELDEMRRDGKIVDYTPTRGRLTALAERAMSMIPVKGAKTAAAS